MPGSTSTIGAVDDLLCERDQALLRQVERAAGMIVTHHAAERFVERVAPSLTVEEARLAIRASAPAIQTAVEFGCGCVIHPSGARLLLEGDVVVTVIGKSMRRHGTRKREAGL